MTGARTTGKSTLVAQARARIGGTLVDLDDPAIRRLALEDPTAFVRGLAEPVIIDEFQRVPELLSVIKSELNRDSRPGRFLLAGSTRHDAVPELADFLTGRVELLRLWPFAVAELEAGAPSVVDRLFSGAPVARRVSMLGRDDLADLVVRGGYPIATRLSAAARSRWLTTLAALVVERVSDDVTAVQNSAVLGRFLRLAAANTAQTRNAAELGREIGVGRDQAGVYLRLLNLVYLTVELPAWSTNLSARVAKRPELHLVDSGLAANLQGLTPGRLAATDPVGATRFGALLETFVVTEVLKQLGWAAVNAAASHYRTADGVEVDLLLETQHRRVAAIQIKAGSTATPAGLAGLRHLRDRIGHRFVAGLLLYAGTHGQQVDDRISVAPVDTLWIAD